MFPVLFKIGSFSFYTHGLLAVLGIILGAVVLYRLAKREQRDTSYLFDNLVYAVLIGIVGARLTYFFLYREQFSNLWEILWLWQGGMVSYGGFIVGGLGLYLVLKQQRQPVRRWFDLFAVAFPAGLTLGRVGNVMAGEYSGIATESKFNLSGVVPVTMYESIITFCLFLILLLLYKKQTFQKEGMLFCASIFLYGLARFILDFWRAEVDLIGPLSLGQVVSLLLVIFASIYYLGVIKRKA